MTDYTPKDGDKVHLTLKATFNEGNRLAGGDQWPGYWIDANGEWLNAGALGIVSVVPAPVVLPTKRGAVVAATFDDERVIACLADPGSGCPWWITPFCEWVSGQRLSAVTVISEGVDE